METSVKYIIGFFALVSTGLFCSYTSYAQINPAQMAINGLICFGNKVYAECQQAYRLNQSGNLNVPPAATDQFCNGPCLAETEMVLNCVNNIASNFVFNNRATVQAVRSTLGAGCSYTSQRGNFDVSKYVEGETSSARTSPGSMGFYASATLMGGWLLLVVATMLG